MKIQGRACPLCPPLADAHETRRRLLILHFTIFWSHKKLHFSKNFDNVIACDLRFGPPLQSKLLATPMQLVNFFS